MTDGVNNLSKRFNPQKHQINECRNLLLDFINSVYPASIAEDDLLDVMLDLPRPVPHELTRRDLGYLEARGFIAGEITDHPIYKQKTKRWKLTAAGVDFVETGKAW
jgi:hypothetical protein